MAIWHTVEIHFKDGTQKTILGMRNGSVTIQKDGTCKIHCIDKNSTEGVYVYEEVEYVNFIKHEGGLFP